MEEEKKKEYEAAYLEQLALFCLIGEECEAKHSQPLKREQGAAMSGLLSPRRLDIPQPAREVQ